MAEASFRHGDPLIGDFTLAGGNLSAGAVVLLGNLTGLTCIIAAEDTVNNVTGSFHVGGGIYDVTMLTNLAPGSKVYWDDANNKVSSTSTNNATFGFLITGNTGANTVVEALHIPWV